MINESTPHKLYRLNEGIRYPTAKETYSNERPIKIEYEVVEGRFSFVWPNGYPCVLVEMYLNDLCSEVKISKTDGGTVGIHAYNLSHIVRYCFEKKVEFWELRSLDIENLKKRLLLEVDGNKKKVRNNNTIKSIISSTIRFLIWLQNNYATDMNIAGVDTHEKRHQIKLKRGSRITKKGYRVIFDRYDSSLPIATSSPKKPISEKAIKLLWDTLAGIKSEARVNNRLLSIFTQLEQKEHLEYMHKRRELQLALLSATGLRPQELIRIVAGKNLEYLEKSTLLLPTLKREMNRNRVIPIDRATAIRVELFIRIYRQKLINRLLKYGLISSREIVDDVIYLNSETARAVKPDAAYQEFYRLTKKAKISQKNCQSMFRHRFITNMVKMHLISFMDKNPLKNRQLMTDDDYRTILAKVARFTDHRNLESLLVYIDLAWEEMDVFAYAEDLIKIQDRFRSIMHLTSFLKGEVSLLKSKINKKEYETIFTRLDEIEKLSLDTKIK